MAIFDERPILIPAEADHRIANNLASLNGVIRLQRNAISKAGNSFSAEQVCSLLDDVRARIEVTAKLHHSLARTATGNGVNLGAFLREISEMIATLGPDGHMELRVAGSCEAHIDPSPACRPDHRGTPHQREQIRSSDRTAGEHPNQVRYENRWIVRGGGKR
jgi:two-component sensor histidine kinase